jgi:hypothetical protein
VTGTRRPSFFFAYSIALAVAASVGFALKAVLQPDAMPRINPLILVHALLMFSWFVVLIAQTSLVRTGRTPLHRRLGMWSLIVTLGAIGTGLALSFAAYDPEESMLLPNMAMLLNYGVMYAAGLLSRQRDLASHKRWMVLSGATMLGPSLGRACAAIGVPLPLTMLIWLFMLAPLWVHDLRALRRVHRVTAAGTALVIIGVGVASALSVNAHVKGWLDGLLG